MLVIHVINGTIYMADYAYEGQDTERVPMIPVTLNDAVEALSRQPHETVQ
jgi:thiamine transporter ThiT